MTLFTTVRGLQFWLTEKDFKEGKVAHYIRQNYHLLIALPAAGLLQRLHIRHLQHVLQQLYSGKVQQTTITNNQNSIFGCESIHKSPSNMFRFSSTTIVWNTVPGIWLQYNIRILEASHWLA